ncbi:hypothetical protein DIPPA_06583 [Diplonema papillatum]|nr:hypothetical protein DIPPA_06583 [Diplonema papillatum]
MVWFDPAVCWVALENRPINLSDSFAGNGVARDDTLTVMVRMLGGGGRGTYKGSKGAVSSSSETRASPGNTEGRSNGKGDTKGHKGEKGGKTNKGNGKRGGLVWDDGVDSDVSDRADLYRHWEAPETRFKAVFPLHLYEGSYAQASWEEAHSSPYQWAQFYLHSALGRGTINSCWDASAKQEFLRGEIRQTLEILFTTSAANETDVLRASGRAGTYFEPLNQPEDYRVLMLPDGASEGDAHSVAGKIGHLQLGLAYCRGELGVRVKASSYAEARELLPELPAEIAYFAVAGIPCGTNAGTLQRNLMRLGWDTTPLFKLSKAGRHTEWAVKSETHPGTYQCDLLNGLRIAIRRVHRCPIQPSRHVAGMRLSSTFREETGRDLTRRDPLAKGSTEPVRFSVFVERYGKGAPAIWELAGDSLNRMDEDEDGNDEGPDGTPLAGGSAVELRKPAMQYARPDGSLPPARTTSSTPSSSPPVDPPRMVADLDERELKTLVRNLVSEATTTKAPEPAMRSTNQPPAQDAAAFQKFVGDIVQERVAEMERRRPLGQPAPTPTLNAPQIAALVESAVDTRVSEMMTQLVQGPLQTISEQLSHMWEHMQMLTTKVGEAQATMAGSGPTAVPVRHQSPTPDLPIAHKPSTPMANRPQQTSQPDSTTHDTKDRRSASTTRRTTEASERRDVRNDDPRLAGFGFFGRQLLERERMAANQTQQPSHPPQTEETPLTSRPRGYRPSPTRATAPEPDAKDRKGSVQDRETNADRRERDSPSRGTVSLPTVNRADSTTAPLKPKYQPCTTVRTGSPTLARRCNSPDPRAPRAGQERDNDRAAGTPVPSCSSTEEETSILEETARATSVPTPAPYEPYSTLTPASRRAASPHPRASSAGQRPRHNTDNNLQGEGRQPGSSRNSPMRRPDGPGASQPQ